MTMYDILILLVVITLSLFFVNIINFLNEVLIKHLEKRIKKNNPQKFQNNS